MEKIKGIISVVAKTGGIRIDDSETWYNPKGNAVKYVKPELKGKEVEITLVENSTDFNFISVIGGSTGANTEATGGFKGKGTSNYTPRNYGSESVKIYKQVALKCATELCANDKIDVEAILKQAKMFTDWIVED